MALAELKASQSGMETLKRLVVALSSKVDHLKRRQLRQEEMTRTKRVRCFTIVHQLSSQLCEDSDRPFHILLFLTSSLPASNAWNDLSS